MQYYPSYNDENWNTEIESVMPFIPSVSVDEKPNSKLKGIDVGCGDRTINKEVETIDLDKSRNPQTIAPADALPFKENVVDYITSIHTFEHFKDQIKVLKEWRRILKVGGIIAIVHPDRKWTAQKSVSHEEKQRQQLYVHEHERTEQEFIEWFERLNPKGLKIFAHGSALGDYSFFVIIQKTSPII